MRRILRRPEADEDLLEIALRIARGNPTAADRFIDRIMAKLNLLAT